MPRERKYPLHDLEVGDVVLIPWLTDANGERLAPRKQDSIAAAVRQEARRFGRQFYWMPEAYGLRVKRIK